MSFVIKNPAGISSCYAPSVIIVHTKCLTLISLFSVTFQYIHGRSCSCGIQLVTIIISKSFPVYFIIKQQFRWCDITILMVSQVNIKHCRTVRSLIDTYGKDVGVACIFQSERYISIC